MGALRLLVALLAALRCLRLAIPCRHPSVRSCASSGAAPHRPGRCSAGVPPALPSWRQRALPGSWATRSAFALLSDPGRASVPSHLAARRCCPAESITKAPAIKKSFAAQSHGFCGRCLRFAVRVAPAQRKTRFRLPATLYRVGLATHRVATKGSDAYFTSSSFPRLCRLCLARRPHFDRRRRLAASVPSPSSPGW